MLTRLQTYLSKPQSWLTAGVVCFGLSAVVGYHHDQMSANSVLAHKVGMPSEVMIQNFSTERHTNIIDEFQVLAEVDLTKASKVNAGTSGKPRWIHVVPMFAVSADARPLALGQLNRGKLRRPVPRSAAADIGMKAEHLRLVIDRPMGVLVQEVGETAQLTPALFGLTVIGAGSKGQLMRISGVHLRGTSLLEAAIPALAKKGLEPMQGAFALSPYSKGRESALAVPDLTWLTNGFTALSLILLAVALSLALRIFPNWHRGGKESQGQVETIAAFPAALNRSARGKPS